MASASLHDDGYLIDVPQLVGDLETFLVRIRSSVKSDDCVLLGCDFPIGLPKPYAHKVGIADFVLALPEFGHGIWAAFYQVAKSMPEISLHRPFYPQRPGGSRRHHLLDKLGFQSIEDLLRECEKSPPLPRRAAPLFWTLGAQQVGKAALNGWREVIVPGLLDPSLEVVLWPFSGPLEKNSTSGRIVIAETYPTVFYHQLRLIRGFERLSKRSQSARQKMASRLAEYIADQDISMSPQLQAALANGFGPGVAGEDPIDAVIGLSGMLTHLIGEQPHFEPDDESILKIEGWIFGVNPR